MIGAEDEQQLNDISRHVYEKKINPMNISRKERTVSMATPWLCNTTTEWKDLGSHHFPRFVKETVCGNSSCMYGTYRCRRQYYSVFVLSVRNYQDEIEFGLPPLLRTRWKFTNLDISVACVCSLH